MQILELDTKKFAHKITLEVKLKRVNEWGLRLKIACLLIRFAAWIAWFNVEFV
jgi:hypothetical protein